MGIRSVAAEAIESAIWAANWIRSSLASDGDVEAVVDDAAGNEHGDAEAAEVWTIAGVQSRPKDGSESEGYAKALRVQLGDSVLIIGTHDPRHVEECEPGELVLHALGKDGSRRAKVVIKPDGTIDVSGTEVVIGNPDGTLEPIPLGTAIKNHLTSVKSWLDSHTHVLTIAAASGTGGTGTAAPPAGPSPSVPTIESAKHKVEA